MSFKVFIVKIFTTIWFIGRYRKIFLKVQKKPHVKYFPLLLQKNILEYWAKCILKISYTASIYHIIYKINIQYIFRNYFPFVVPQYDDPMMLNNIIQPNVCDWLVDATFLKLGLTYKDMVDSGVWQQSKKATFINNLKYTRCFKSHLKTLGKFYKSLSVIHGK